MKSLRKRLEIQYNTAIWMQQRVDATKHPAEKQRRQRRHQRQLCQLAKLQQACEERKR